MALSGKAHGKDLVFKLDTQAGSLKDISAYVKGVDGLPGEKDMGDVTTGGSSGYKNLPGLQKADFSIECVFDDAVDSAYDVVKDFMSDVNARSFEYGPAGLTSGYAKLNRECRIKKVTFPAKVTDPLTFTVDLALDDALTIGTWT
jgi:hypothetical protein